MKARQQRADERAHHRPAERVGGGVGGDPVAVGQQAGHREALLGQLKGGLHDLAPAQAAVRLVQGGVAGEGGGDRVEGGVDGAPWQRMLEGLRGFIALWRRGAANSSIRWCSGRSTRCCGASASAAAISSARTRFWARSSIEKGVFLT